MLNLQLHTREPAITQGSHLHKNGIMAHADLPIQPKPFIVLIRGLKLFMPLSKIYPEFFGANSLHHKLGLLTASKLSIFLEKSLVLHLL